MIYLRHVFNSVSGSHRPQFVGVRCLSVRARAQRCKVGLVPTLSSGGFLGIYARSTQLIRACARCLPALLGRVETPFAEHQQPAWCTPSTTCGDGLQAMLSCELLRPRNDARSARTYTRSAHTHARAVHNTRMPSTQRGERAQRTHARNARSHTRPYARFRPLERIHTKTPARARRLATHAAATSAAIATAVAAAVPARCSRPATVAAAIAAAVATAVTAAITVAISVATATAIPAAVTAAIQKPSPHHHRHSQCRIRHRRSQRRIHHRHSQRRSRGSSSCSRQIVDGFYFIATRISVC